MCVGESRAQTPLQSSGLKLRQGQPHRGYGPTAIRSQHQGNSQERLILLLEAPRQVHTA